MVANPGPGYYWCLIMAQKALGGWMPLLEILVLKECVALTNFRVVTLTVSMVLGAIRNEYMMFFNHKDALDSYPPEFLTVPLHSLG